MTKMQFLFTWTQDDLRLPGIHYVPAQKEMCLVFVHGMSGFFVENYFAHILGEQLQKAGIGFIYAHNRGYCHLNDIATKEANEDGGYKTRRIGAVYERFNNCVYDIY